LSTFEANLNRPNPWKSKRPPKKLDVKCGSPQAAQALKGAEQLPRWADVVINVVLTAGVVVVVEVTHVVLVVVVVVVEGANVLVVLAVVVEVNVVVLVEATQGQVLSMACTLSIAWLTCCGLCPGHEEPAGQLEMALHNRG